MSAGLMCAMWSSTVTDRDVCTRCTLQAAKTSNPTSDNRRNTMHCSTYGGMRKTYRDRGLWTRDPGQSLMFVNPEGSLMRATGSVIRNLFVISTFIAPFAYAQERGAAQAADQAVPADLKPLLAPHRSEMRLVITRYNADRGLLESNYAGQAGAGGNVQSGRGGGGGGGGG